MEDIGKTDVSHIVPRIWGRTIVLWKEHWRSQFFAKGSMSLEIYQAPMLILSKMEAVEVVGKPTAIHDTFLVELVENLSRPPFPPPIKMPGKSSIQIYTHFYTCRHICVYMQVSTYIFAYIYIHIYM